MRLFITGATGVLGRQFCPLASAAGHHLEAPGHAELDLFDPAAVKAAVRAGRAGHRARPTRAWVRPCT